MSIAPSAPAAPQPARHAYIDGLRGQAILGVLLVHFSGYLVFGNGEHFRTGVLREFCDAGARGVQLFFMLSAFTLFASSKVRFASDPSPRLSFYVRRAFRILPLWWAAVTIYARCRSGGNPWPSYLMYFGFVRYKDGAEVFPMGWSIFVEETFYLMLPLVFARITGLRRALVFVAQMSALAILWDQFAPKLGVPNGHAFIAQFPLNQWFAIAIGIALFHLQEQPSFRRVMLDDPSAAPLIDALTAVALFCLLRQPHMAASLGLALLFVASMSPHTLFGKAARNRVLGLFGTCCYSIYLLHQLLLDRFLPARDGLYAAVGLARATPDVRLFVGLPVFAAACLAVGLLCWYGFERPCIELGKRVNAALARPWRGASSADPRPASP